VIPQEGIERKIWINENGADLKYVIPQEGIERSLPVNPFPAIVAPSDPARGN